MSRFLAIAIVLFAGFAAPVRAVADGLVVLELTGATGQTYDGDCRLRQANGIVKRHRLRGRIPTKIFFPTPVVRCSLQKKGAGKTVTATLRVDQKIAVQITTRPALNWILISSPGPWGPARAQNLAARPVWQ